MTAKKLDRESVSQYTVVLVCHDFGRPALSTTVLFDVSVTDVNDNDPVFFVSDGAFDQSDSDDVISQSRVTYVAELFENNFIGAFVAQVGLVRDSTLCPNKKCPPDFVVCVFFS